MIGGPCVMCRHLPTFLYCCTSLTTSSVLWRSIPCSCQALCDLSLLLSPMSSPVSPVFLLFSSCPAYFLLLEHSTCTPTPECLYLLFLLPGMPFAQLPFPNSLGLDSAMPFKRGLPFHLWSRSSIRHTIISLVCHNLCLCPFSILFTTVTLCLALSRHSINIARPNQ